MAKKEKDQIQYYLDKMTVGVDDLVDEAAKEQEHQGMGIGRRGRIEFAQPQEREQDQRQQRRDRERQGLGHPPDRHPDPDRRGPPALLRQPLGRWAQEHDKPRERPCKEADQAVAREARELAFLGTSHGLW